MWWPNIHWSSHGRLLAQKAIVLLVDHRPRLRKAHSACQCQRRGRQRFRFLGRDQKLPGRSQNVSLAFLGSIQLLNPMTTIAYRGAERGLVPLTSNEHEAAIESPEEPAWSRWQCAWCLTHLLHHAGRTSVESAGWESRAGVVSRRRGGQIAAAGQWLSSCSVGGSATPQARNTALLVPRVSVRRR